MSEYPQATTHKPSMNLRFVERAVPAGENVARKVKILQQMFVPLDWSKHDEIWLDVPCYEETP